MSVLPSDEIKCPCAEAGVLNSKIANLTINVALTFMACRDQFGLCPATQNISLEMSIMTMITYMTQHDTVIESYSQEAEWEAERVIVGIEERLLTRLRAYYAEARKMSPEKRDEIKERYDAKIRGMLGQGGVR